MRLDNYPIFKILLPFLIGIIIAYLCDFQEQNRNMIFFLTIVIVVVSIAISILKSYRYDFIQFIFIELSFLLVGIIQTDRKYPKSACNTDREGNYIVRLVSGPSIKERSIKFEAEIIKSDDDSIKSGKILLYYKHSKAVSQLTYGDILLTHTKLQRIRSPSNPNVFNNEKYMRRRGVYFTGFVRENDWIKVGHKPKYFIWEIAQKTRGKCVSIYESAGMKGEEMDVLKAILLGDDDTLEPSLKKSYSSAGVSHILCVSGMHVGIIFMIINFLLKPLDYFKTTRIIKTILMILFIWYYANITGLAPSVSRSAAMFTFVAIGQVLQRNTNVFHSLFASMFILLMRNPLLLFEVGFQLSYLAVFGIVIFQPKIASIINFRTKIGKYFWEILSVSVAAQLATSPISIYYFSQFPNYFMFSNLAVITLSFVVVITGVVLVLSSLIPFLSEFISKILTIEISLMNKIIVNIEKIPFSVTKNIDYNIMQVILLYMTICLVSLFLYHNRKKYLLLAGLFFTAFVINFPIKRIINLRIKELLVYNIKNCTALEFRCDGKTYIFSDSIKDKKDRLYEYNIAAHSKKNLIESTIIRLDTAEYSNLQLLKRGNFIRFIDKNYLIVDKNIDKIIKNINCIEIDCVILHNNPNVAPEELQNITNFKEVIIDASNGRYIIEEWRKYCLKKGFPICITGERKYE